MEKVCLRTDMGFGGQEGVPLPGTRVHTHTHTHTHPTGKDGGGWRAEGIRRQCSALSFYMCS